MSNDNRTNGVDFGRAYGLPPGGPHKCCAGKAERQHLPKKSHSADSYLIMGETVSRNPLQQLVHPLDDGLHCLVEQDGERRRRIHLFAHDKTRG